MKPSIVRILYLLLTVSLVTGCAQNKPWRINPPQACLDNNQGCSDSYIELHDKDKYELAFVEFTEVGNEFSSDKTHKILEKIEGYAKSPEGVSVIVFVHGWKHNASDEDSNVHSFRSVLKSIANSGSLGTRKLVGVYVGWRGISAHGLGIENLTFWDRKAVAEEVGKGGVTEFFLKLENIDRYNDKRNILFIVGHSFGGAITLSALHDVLLTRMILAKKDKPVRRFGEGIILINPAIEANQILELKEESMKFKILREDQGELLHVISSKGDIATSMLFPIGQFLGVGLTWQHEDIDRIYDGKKYILSEFDMDLSTIGNYDRFITGKIVDDHGSTDNLAGRWRYTTLCGKSGKDMPVDSLPEDSHTNQPHDPLTSSLPCSNNDPVVFLTTTDTFIGDHNDVFNDNVKAYLSTIVSEALTDQGETAPPPCLDKDAKSFSFTNCFNFNYSLIRNAKTAK